MYLSGQEQVLVSKILGDPGMIRRRICIFWMLLGQQDKKMNWVDFVSLEKGFELRVYIYIYIKVAKEKKAWSRGVTLEI